MTIAISSPNLELTPSLINPSSHDHHGHVVQLYTDDNFLIDVLTRFVGGAIAAGDRRVEEIVPRDARGFYKDEHGRSAGCQLERIFGNEGGEH